MRIFQQSSSILFFALLFPFLAFSNEPVKEKLKNNKPVFIPNEGQVSDLGGEEASEVLYYARSRDYTVFFRERGVSYVFREKVKQQKVEGVNKFLADENEGLVSQLLNMSETRKGFRLDMDFDGASAKIQLKGKVKQNRPRFNFYYPHCKNGITDVKGYRELVYQKVYPGIDIRFYFKEGQLKYDIKVAAKANPEKITFQYRPKDAIELETNKDALEVRTSLDTLHEVIPVAFQEEAGMRIEKSCEYRLLEGGKVALAFGSDYKSSQPLLIDPLVRSWATYFGAYALYDVDCDEGINCYLTGYVDGNSNFPTTPGAFQTSTSSNSATISKMDSANQLIWSTYYGGSVTERGQGLTQNGSDLSVSGHTSSGDFPVSAGAFQTNFQGTPVFDDNNFLLHFDTSGIRKWATFLGKRNNPFMNSTARAPSVVRKNGYIGITGTTPSNNFPISTNAYQASLKGNSDAFFAIFDTLGKRVYSTYFGGSGDDAGYDISFGCGGNWVISGQSSSQDFPTKKPFQNTNNGAVDGVLFAFDTTFAFSFGTYIGGSNDDVIYSLECDGKKQIFAGGTYSSNFPVTSNNLGTFGGSGEGVLGKMDLQGNVDWSFFYGGNSGDYITDIDIDNKGSIYITGSSNSSDLKTTPQAFAKNYPGGGTSLFFGKFDAQGVFQYATFYGGSFSEYGNSIAIDAYGNSYIVGNSFSNDFPTTSNALFGSKQNSNSEAIAVKFSPCILDTLSISLDSIQTYCQGDTVKVTADSGFSNYRWYEKGSNTILDTTLNLDFQKDGNYILRALTSTGCAAYDTAFINIGDSSDFQAPLITSTQTLADSIIKVQWEPRGADSFFSQYNLYRKREDQSSFQLIDSLSNYQDTFYTDSTANKADSLAYRYYLTMDNLCNDSAYKGNEFKSMVIDTVSNSSDSVTFSWNKPFDTFAGTYRLVKEGGATPILIDSTTDTTFTLGLCEAAGQVRVAYTRKSDTGKSNLSDLKNLVQPPAPELHFVSLQDSQRVALQWAPSPVTSTVDGYLIEREQPGGPFQAIDTVNGRLDTTYTDSLTNKIDRSVCYRVKAIDSCGGNASLPSENHCTIYLTSDTTDCQQQINLSWNAYQGFDSIEQYEIYRQKEGGSRNLLATVDGKTTSYTDSQVSYSFSYNYEVKAISGKTPYTSLSNDTTNQTFKPNTPFVQSASKITTYPGSGKVKISWNNQQSQPLLDHQKLYYKAPDSNVFILLQDSIPLNQDSFIHQNLNTKQKDHRYYLTTVDSCGNESDSAGIHKTMELEFDVGQLLHDLSWTPYEGWPMARYEVQRRQGSIFQTVDTLAGGDTAIAKSPEPCNSLISYRIKAVDSQGNYAYSDTGINEALDTLNPDAATLNNVSIQNDTVAEIQFTGADSLDIFSYDVMRKRGNGNYQLAERVIFDSAGGNFTVYDTTNTIQDPLCYKVLTQDSCLNTVTSDSFCANYLQGNPQNLASGLSWQKFDGYPIDSQYVLKFNGTNYDTLARLGGNDTAYEDTSLRCNRPYGYKVLSFEQGGNRTTKSNPRTVIPFDTVPPATPDLRQATVENSDSITITWDTSADIDVDRYEIFYAKRGDSFKSAGIVTEQNQQLNSFTHDTSAIDPLSKSYCYYVEAIDSCSDVHSVPSDTHCVIELEAKGGQRENHLNWQGYEGTGIDRYIIERQEKSSWETIDTVPGTDTAYTDSNNARCTISYDYRIRAEWNDGMSFTSESDTAEAMPFDTVNPKAPYIESFSVKSYDSAEVTWQLSNTDVKQYELWLKTKNGTWQTKDTVGVQTSYAFGNLNTLDSQYCTRLVAIDSCAANRSNFSKTHCAIQLSGAPGQKENHLNWAAYEGWDSTAAYYVYNKNPQNLGWQVIDTVKGSDTSYTHTNVPCNRPQHYKVEGKNDSGFTAFSDSLTLTPFDTVAPDAPAINYVTVKKPDTIEGFFDTANAQDLGEYVIYANASNQPYQAIDTIADTGQSANHFTHTGIRPDTGQYCYRIRSIDSCAGNISGFSDPHCAVELQGTAGNLETNLNWHPYQGFTNPTYLIQRKGNTASWQTLGSRTDTNFNDTTNLACNAVYTYRILTLSPTGNDTSYSDTLNLKPFDTTAPQVPQLQFASVEAEVEVEWEWDLSSDQKYFEIWRDQGNGNFTNLDTVTYDSTFRDTSANPSQTHHAYFVRAIDSCAADGAIGAPGNRSTPSDTDRIMVPEVSTGACLPEARLNWTPYEDLPEDIDYYRIHRKDSTSSFQQVAQANDTAFTDTTIKDFTRYCYRIEAVDTQSGYTAYSDSLCMQPFVYPIPDTSEVIRATVEETDESMGEILVEWERGPKSDTFARGYFIYHRTSNSATYNLIHNQTSLEDTTYRHQGINTSKLAHEYRIVIYNLCVEQGGYRNVHRPPKISGRNQNLAIALNWWPYQGFDVQGYEVQRSVNGGAFNTFRTFSSGDTAFTDSTVRCGQDYTYRIYAEGDGPKEQSLSDTLTFTAYDTIPPDRAKINRGTITQTSETNGITELDFEPATQANRKGYIIYRSEDNSRFVPVDTVLTNASNTITYNDSILNTQYSILSYYVRSIDSCGNVAAPSDTHQLINLQAEPENLANEVTWNAYEGWADWYYELQRRRPNSNWRTLGRLASDSLSYTDSTKNCDTLYFYRVKATNTQTGAETYSNYDTARSIDQEAPEPPELERITVEENGDVQVEWEASPSNDLEYYHLFRQPASSNNFQQATSNLATLDYTDEQTQATEEPISYRLRSEDSCNNVSEPSGIHTTIHLTAEPGQEQNELTWTAYGGWDVATYEVYKDGNQVAELGTDRRSYTDVRAVCTTHHEYRIRAIKESGEAVFSWSNIDSAQARDNNLPQVVNLKTATVIDPNEVVGVRWEASADYDADGYEIYRSGLNSSGLSQIASVENAETTRFRDTLSQPTNQQFCYQVRVKDFCGNVSERSNNGCVMGIEGEASEGNNQISWDEYYEWPGSIAYYEVYKKEDSSFYEQIDRIQETNYTDENLANQVTDFCYQVEAHHSAGDETSRSFEVCLQQPQIVHIPNSFTPGTTEGINDEFGPEGLYIQNFEMQIFNRWGERVFSTSDGKQWDGTYEGQPVPAGVYLYSITIIGEDGRTESYEGSINVVR